jgi:hypothetical protein
MQKPLDFQGFFTSKSFRNPLLYPLSYGGKVFVEGQDGSAVIQPLTDHFSGDLGEEQQRRADPPCRVTMPWR